MSSPLTNGQFQADNGNGQPLAGGKLYTYVSGTTTPQATYTNASLSTPNSNPVLLNARGEAQVWLGSGIYTLALHDASDVPIWSVDGVADTATGLAGSAGASKVGFIQAGSGAVPRTAQDKMRERISVDDFGALGDGSTDDSLAINSAIAAAAALGGASVVFGPGKNYRHTSTIVLSSGVVLHLYGSTLTWGGTGAPQISTSTTGYTINAGIVGGVIDGGGNATKLVELWSPYHCAFRDVTLKSNSATNVALDILVNTSGATNPDGNRNAVFNEFSNLLQEGSCGTAVRLMGQGPVNGPALAVVTLNTFVNFNGRGACVRGIDFAAWADSNFFAGITRVSLIANNAVGVVWNSGTPAGNVGVYSNNFNHLAVDTFGTFTGRVGFKMNWTKLNKVDYYFQDPPAEGGPYYFDANCQSYYVVHQLGLSSSTVIRSKLFYAQGIDNAILPIGGAEVSTETVGLQLGVNRSGSGFANIDLIGDTTYPQFGLRLIRNNGGPNTSSEIHHRGTGNFALSADDAGAQIILQTQNGPKLVTSNTGMGFYGVGAVAQPTTAGAASAFTANTGTGVNDASTFDGYTIKQLVKALRTMGLLA